jgi:hypothetical protein
MLIERSAVPGAGSLDFGARIIGGLHGATHSVLCTAKLQTTELPKTSSLAIKSSSHEAYAAVPMTTCCLSNLKRKPQRQLTDASIHSRAADDTEGG